VSMSAPGSPVSVWGMGVVGAGIMGRRMMAALQQHPRWRVAAAWDPHAVALPDGVPRAESLEALLHDAAVDAVYIASPPAAHQAGVLAALAAGHPVLCEKPLTHDVASAQALRDAVMASGLPFAVNFPLAASPSARRLVDIVRAGTLGDVQEVRVTVRFARWPREWQAGASAWLGGAAEGGFTREVLSHFVFLAQRLFGPGQVAAVQLERVRGQAETRLQARLQLGGVPLHIDAAVAGDIADDNRFEVVGSRDRVALRQWAQLEHGGIVHDQVDAAPSPLDGFARLLDGDAGAGLATVDEALAVVRSIEALLAG
jgi:predicted dehydrogenase